MSESTDLRWTLATVVALLAVGLLPTTYLALQARWLSYRIRGLSLLVFAAALVVFGLGVRRRLLLRSPALHDTPVRVAADLVAVLALLAYVPLALGLFRPASAAVYPGMVGIPGALLYFVLGHEASPLVLTRRRLGLVVALLLVGVGLVGYDVRGPDVAYEERSVENQDVFLQADPVPNGTTTVPARAGFVVYEARNDFRYERPLKLADYDACVVGDDRGVVRDLEVDMLIPLRFFDERIEGDEDGSITVSATLRLRVTDGEPPDVAIERGSDCTVEREQPTILFWKAAEHRPVPYDDSSDSSGTGDRNASATG